MKASTEIHGYSDTDNEIIWFWTAVESLTSLERKKLLQFITGSSSVPSSGLSGITPKLTITRSYQDKDSLPISHTCFNRLDLPPYSSYTSLQSRLIIAVNEGYAGFALG